ncbi:MAG: EFR1 family ferrodoxin [Sphaerochaetaceae bacterium]|nr:EFR1 family ferrodoxin [Sphaerochaetaceae bacterium]
MVFYFSACGNSKYVAAQIAKETDDEIFSIDNCLKENNLIFDLNKVQRVGIISPVYFLGIPNIVSDFLDKVDFLNYSTSYFYTVITFGTTTGAAASFVEKALKKKSINLNASFSVRYPDTFTPIFNITNDKANLKKINKAENTIPKIINSIIKKTSKNFIKNKLPYILVANYHHSSYKKKNDTKTFTVEDSCISCGLCENKCPVDAIELKDGKPVWIKKSCVICLGCLHRCPVSAIQFGPKTKEHGRYINPNIKI